MNSVNVDLMATNENIEAIKNIKIFEAVFVGGKLTLCTFKGVVTQGEIFVVVLKADETVLLDLGLEDSQQVWYIKG